jgi:hypothetical protein
MNNDIKKEEGEETSETSETNESEDNVEDKNAKKKEPDTVEGLLEELTGKKEKSPDHDELEESEELNK